MIVRLLSLAAALACAAPAAASSCDALAKQRFDKLTILSAEAVAAGDFRTPAAFGPAPSPIALPAYCQVRAVATPVPGSRIGFELWMPVLGWNGRFKMFGNGGYSSALPYGQLAAGLQGGYAVTATDTGHQGDDPDFAVGLPESIADWGHRAVHQTAVNAKALVHAFYRRGAAHAYFEGCSTGGHQALMSAQRYPGDFDGIIAGAPGNNRTRLNIGFLWQFVANRRRSSTEPLLTAAKLPLLTNAALAQCGSAAERARGYLENPFLCRVDLARLQCRGGDAADCLTTMETGAAARMYDGARNPRTGTQIYPPWLPGSEAGWSSYWADPRNPEQPMRANFFRFWAFRDPAWNWRSFDFDRDVARVDRAVGKAIDATDPDLSRFAAMGGKLLIYHGLADPVVSPWDSRNYYDALQRRAGAGSSAFARLFFAPGMGHCGGGPGPALDPLQPILERWREGGDPPRALPLRAPRVGEAPRALCPYPAVGGNCAQRR